ncbi:MAG: hypothetical protein IAE86_06115 [Burkholderiaceae bacterium]|nr:hypothetical protein [Burkholderiaceae bacterium]
MATVSLVTDFKTNLDATDASQASTLKLRRVSWAPTARFLEKMMFGRARREQPCPRPFVDTQANWKDVTGNAERPMLDGL